MQPTMFGWGFTPLGVGGCSAGGTSGARRAIYQAREAHVRSWERVLQLPAAPDGLRRSPAGAESFGAFPTREGFEWCLVRE